jgi:hypothetical protein|tara:strand:- start:145 stop:534 length:390 start_codon:yes stop_codon:yes gene_type:complete
MKLSELDIYFFGRTLSEEDRAKARQKDIDNGRGLFSHKRKVYNSEWGEEFFLNEITYSKRLTFNLSPEGILIGMDHYPVREVVSGYDEKGKLARRVTNFYSNGEISKIYDVTFNPPGTILGKREVKRFR